MTTLVQASGTHDATETFGDAAPSSAAWGLGGSARGSTVCPRTLTHLPPTWTNVDNPLVSSGFRQKMPWTRAVQ